MARCRCTGRQGCPTQCTRGCVGASLRRPGTDCANTWPFGCALRRQGIDSQRKGLFWKVGNISPAKQWQKFGLFGNFLKYTAKIRIAVTSEIHICICLIIVWIHFIFRFDIVINRDEKWGRHCVFLSNKKQQPVGKTIFFTFLSYHQGTLYLLA
jgi:hypothetical protein